VDKKGTPLAPALMYNDARATKEAQQLQHLAPKNSGAHGATSSLAKLLWLLKNTKPHNISHAQHQADWLAGKLTGRFDISDENNCLKMGYDPLERQWPTWVLRLGFDMNYLPQVQAPGTPIATIKEDIARQIGLNPETVIVSGTTDSLRCQYQYQQKLGEMTSFMYHFIKKNYRDFEARSPRFILDVQDKSWTPLNFRVD
jgi:sugar (pentulose or hexulose) kinase